jgi:hypothetical protein
VVLDRKHGGYWGVFVAVGLALAPFSGQAQEQAQGPSGAPAEQHHEARPPRTPTPVEIIEREEAAAARERSEAEAAQREKADLVAQQGMNTATQAMNDATKEMAFYSLLSTALVGIGTALLTWTLLLTRQANKAARDAVSVTREIGAAQVRAYLSVTGIEVSNLKLGDRFRIRASLRNYGNSPAYEVNVRCEGDFLDDPNTSSFRFKYVGTEIDRFRIANAVIGPGVGVTISNTKGSEISQEAFDLFVNRKKVLVFVVVANYKDAFNIKKMDTDPIFHQRRYACGRQGCLWVRQAPQSQHLEPSQRRSCVALPERS